MTIPKPTPPAAALEFIAPPTTDPDAESVPPEGLDGATAWAEISDLRAEVRDLKARIADARRQTAEAAAALDELKVRASAADADLAANAEERATSLAAVTRELATLRALRRYPALEAIADGLDEFLTGNDEPTILASAERLASALARSTTTPSATPTLPAPAISRAS